MAHRLINARNVKRAAVFFGEHRTNQVVNALRYEWHALRGFPLVRLPYSPVNLILFVTTRCNLRCAYCQYHGPAASRGPQRPLDMSLETVRQVLDRFPLAISVSVGGAGDPMLHPGIFDMLHLIHEHHMQTAVATNGTSLRGNIARVLRAPVGFMNVSFYGVDGETFARRTGASAGLFDDMLEALAELARRRRGRRGPRLLRGSFVCTKESLEEAFAFVALCEKLGLDQAKLSNLTDYGLTGSERPLGLQGDDPAAQAFVARLRQMHHRIPVLLPRLLKRDGESRHCHLPFKDITVGANGCIAPCCVEGPFRESTNVLRNRQAWNAPEMVARRRALSDPAQPLPGVCRQCEKLMQVGPRLRH